MSSARMRALALVDGEHYPEVVRDAFRELEYDVVAAVLVGGTEKLRGDPDYGVPLYDTLEVGLEACEPDVVLDLSDEPVLDVRNRFRLASRALAAGRPYVGADFRFDPVVFAPFDVPALGVIGSGKRVGKTAVAGHVARLLSQTRDVVVVAMGRGGPREPTVTETPPSLDDLLSLSRAGYHAASDYLEDATLAHVPTVGCRRCGGGLAGMPFVSNVEEAGRVAAARSPDLVVLEGSGASIPPLEAARRILVASAAQGAESVAGYLGAYRLLVSDLVVLTMCEEPLATSADVERVGEAIADIDPDLPVLPTVFRPRPVSPISGRRVVLFSTAPAAAHATLREHLEEEHGAEVLLVSGNLGRRPELASDLETAEAHSADLYLVEIKAAAIDVVAETAAERGVEVVFADNAVVPLAGGDALDDHVRALADAVTKVPA